MRQVRSVSRRVFVLVWTSMTAACGEAGSAGPQAGSGPEGAGGTSADPSISAVTPMLVFLDRSIEVLISGVGTQWTSSVVVDYGAGIVPTGIAVAGPTAILGMVDIDSAAALGMRGVSVTDGGVTLAFGGAFAVGAPLVIDTVVGRAAQGSVMLADAHLVDLSSPIDTSNGGGTVFLRLENGSSLSRMAGLGPLALSGLFFIDVNAAPGPARLVLHSGAGVNTVTSRSAPVIGVQPRVPSQLAPGQPWPGRLVDSLETQVYSFSARPNQIVQIAVAAPNGSPLLVLSPPDSTYRASVFGDTVDFFSASTDPWFVTVLDPGARGVDFTVMIDTLTLPPVTYAGPAVADISVAGENDVYSVVANAGETITATVANGPASTCGPLDLHAQLWVYGGMTVVQSESPGFCPTASLTAPVTGAYYVRVRSHRQQCPACTFDYTLTVTVQ